MTLYCYFFHQYPLVHKSASQNKTICDFLKLQARQIHKILSARLRVVYAMIREQKNRRLTQLQWNIFAVKSYTDPKLLNHAHEEDG